MTREVYGILHDPKDDLEEKGYDYTFSSKNDNQMPTNIEYEVNKSNCTDDDVVVWADCFEPTPYTTYDAYLISILSKEDAKKLFDEYVSKGFKIIYDGWSIQPKTESSNKYIKSFREAVEKLEEDDGNPGLLQAMDYDVDNDQMKHDDRFRNLSNKIYDVYAIVDNLYHEYRDNKKLKKVKDLLHDANFYLAGEITKKLDRNEFVNTSYYDDIEPEYDLQNVDYDYLNK